MLDIGTDGDVVVALELVLAGLCNHDLQ
jgi:hypothetical protein